MKFFNMHLSEFPVTSYLLGPNSFVTNVLANILSILACSCNVTDQVSHPYKRTS